MEQMPIMVCLFVFMLVMLMITTGDDNRGNPFGECKKLHKSVLMIMADQTFSSQFWGLSS